MKNLLKRWIFIAQYHCWTRIPPYPDTRTQLNPDPTRIRNTGHHTRSVRRVPLLSKISCCILSIFGDDSLCKATVWVTLWDREAVEQGQKLGTYHIKRKPPVEADSIAVKTLKPVS